MEKTVHTSIMSNLLFFCVGNSKLVCRLLRILQERFKCNFLESWLLIILTQTSKLNILYFEGFKEFKAIAVTRNVLNIYSLEWNPISRVRAVTSARWSGVPTLTKGCGYLNEKLLSTGSKFWNLNSIDLRLPSVKLLYDCLKIYLLIN